MNTLGMNTSTLKMKHYKIQSIVNETLQNTTKYRALEMKHYTIQLGLTLRPNGNETLQNTKQWK